MTPTPKHQSAYRRAYDATISAWGQGVRSEPLSGYALLCAEFSDGQIKGKTLVVNMFREKYRRGIEKLPFLKYPHEFENNQT